MENNIDRTRWNGLRPLDIVAKMDNGIVSGSYKVIFLFSDEDRVHISRDGSSENGEIVNSSDLILLDKVEDYSKDKFDLTDCCD